MFREVRNRCFSVTLPNNQPADLAFQGLIPQPKNKFGEQEFTDLSHRLHQVSAQEGHFTDKAFKDKFKNKDKEKAKVNLVEYESNDSSDDNEVEVNIAKCVKGSKKVFSLSVP